MSKTGISILLLFLIPAFNLIAQGTLFLEGKIIDDKTKEPLPAFVTYEEAETGCTADSNGHFRLSLKSLKNSQKVKLVVWLIGYKKKELEAKIGEYVSIELELEPVASHEVVVTADSIVSDDKSQKTVTLNKMDIYTMPGTAADPMYASHILPGVNSMPDASNILIRGGAPEEVAYFFEGIEIEHPFLSESLHESYFSIFDNQVIENFSVSTSGFPPKFGDALSGVMDITAKDTILEREGGVGISILGFSGYAGVPVKKFGSFVGSYNQSFSDLMTEINNGEESKFGSKNAFAKMNFKLNPSHTIRILGLFDEYNFSDKNGFSTSSKNKIAGVSFTSVLAKNLVTKFTLSRVDYDASYQFQNNFQENIKDNISQARLDTSLELGSHFIEFGADLQNRNIGVLVAESGFENDKTQGIRLGFYVCDKFRISDTVFMNFGGRISSLNLSRNQLNFDPRASLAYLVTKNDILRFSAGMYHQFGDYFILEKNHPLRPKYSVHYSLSYDKIAEYTEIRMTLYTKEYRNLFLSKKEGIISNEGYGYARGAEFFIRKKKENYDALFVYNFLNSKRSENDVPILARSPYEIDHSLTGIFKFNFKNASLSLRYSYASGLPYTPLVGREWDSENQVYFPVWGEPWSQRYPTYQRMDINGSKTFHFQKKLVVIYFGIMNVLNNKNILRYEYSNDYGRRENQYSIFGRSIFIGIYMPFF